MIAEAFDTDTLAVDDSTKAYNKYKKSYNPHDDVTTNSNDIDIDIYKGSKDELQDVKVNNKGYVITRNIYTGDGYISEAVEVIKVSEELQKCIVTNNKLQTKTFDISEIKDIFFKTEERFNAVQARNNYLKLTKEPVDDFIKHLQDAKNNYPEIWL